MGNRPEGGGEWGVEGAVARSAITQRKLWASRSRPVIECSVSARHRRCPILGVSGASRESVAPANCELNEAFLTDAAGTVPLGPRARAYARVCVCVCPSSRAGLEESNCHYHAAQITFLPSPV